MECIDDTLWDSWDSSWNSSSWFNNSSCANVFSNTPADLTYFLTTGDHGLGGDDDHFGFDDCFEPNR